MKNIFNIPMVALLVLVSACDDFDKYELPEANSIPDATPPQAVFTAIQSEEVDNDGWKDFYFSNGSISATTYAWDFGDGNTSSDYEPTNRFSEEGTYTVALTASDNNGLTNTLTQDITVEQPPAPPVPDPTLINTVFDKLGKSSGSDCACSGWINRSLGTQGESSTASGNSVMKFDNNEPDHIYQEFEVTPNANYQIEVEVSFKANAGKSNPASLEFRVLAGIGYDSGYTPTYYTETTAFPQDGYGYSSVAQTEVDANNLMIKVLNNPDDTSYIKYILNFNSGANNSVALFARGIGGLATGSSDNERYGYSSGDEEIRIDNLVVTAL